MIKQPRSRAERSGWRRIELLTGRGQVQMPTYVLATVQRHLPRRRPQKSIIARSSGPVAQLGRERGLLAWRSQARPGYSSSARSCSCSKKLGPIRRPLILLQPSPKPPPSSHIQGPWVPLSFFPFCFHLSFRITAPSLSLYPINVFSRKRERGRCKRPSTPHSTTVYPKPLRQGRLHVLGLSLLPELPALW